MSYKVSVIIPVYNIEAYIVRCMDSIVRQSYRDLEIIPIDDGSTDGCGAILDDYAARDSRIKVIHQANGGLISTRRRGLLSSSADFIFFVDGDDWIELDAIELLGAKQLETDADMVIGSHRKTTDNEIIAEELIPQNNAMMVAEYIPLLLQFKMAWCSIWMKLYRKSIFPADFASFGRHLTMGEDAISNCQLLSHMSRIATEPRAIYNYYQRHSSIAQTYLKRPTIEYEIVMFDAMADAMGEEIALEYRSQINTQLVNKALSIFFIHINKFNETYADTKAYAHIKTLIKADKNICRQLSLKKRLLVVLMSNPFWFDMTFNMIRLIKQGKWHPLTPIESKYED